MTAKSNQIFKHVVTESPHLSDTSGIFDGHKVQI